MVALITDLSQFRHVITPKCRWLSRRSRREVRSEIGQRDQKLARTLNNMRRVGLEVRRVLPMQRPHTSRPSVIECPEAGFTRLTDSQLSNVHSVQTIRQFKRRTSG
jgi:hypothetical protein